MRTQKVITPKATRRRVAQGERAKVKALVVAERGKGMELAVQVVVGVGEEDSRLKDTSRVVDSLRHRLRGADFSNDLSVGRNVCRVSYFIVD